MPGHCVATVFGQAWDIGWIWLHTLPDLTDYATVIAPSARSVMTLRFTLLGLAWEGSPVASQCSYGGLASGLPASSPKRSHWALLSSRLFLPYREVKPLLHQCGGIDQRIVDLIVSIRTVAYGKNHSICDAAVALTRPVARKPFFPQPFPKLARTQEHVLDIDLQLLRLQGLLAHHSVCRECVHHCTHDLFGEVR